MTLLFFLFLNFFLFFTKCSHKVLVGLDDHNNPTLSSWHKWFLELVGWEMILRLSNMLSNLFNIRHWHRTSCQTASVKKGYYMPRSYYSKEEVSYHPSVICLLFCNGPAANSTVFIYKNNLKLPEKSECLRKDYDWLGTQLSVSKHSARN